MKRTIFDRLMSRAQESLIRGDLEEAARLYRQASDAVGGDAAALANLGVVLAKAGRADEAVEPLVRAAASTPNDPRPHYNLGRLLRDLNRPEEAAECYRRVLRLLPDHIEARQNLSFALLAAGRLAEGWPEFESVIRRNEGPTPPFSGPLWEGDDVRGRRVLVHTQEGFGDQIQFARYLPILAERGATVIVTSSPPMARLFRSVHGVNEVLDEAPATIPAYDCWCRLMSLARLAGTTVDTIPADHPYVRAADGARSRWRERLQKSRGLRVGLAWAGRSEHVNDRHRSMTLAALSPLARPGVTLVSLQKGPPAAQIAESGVPLSDWSAELVDFAETAALIEELDLVVSVDTAVAHLAGALGKPTWILLPAVADWRWLLQRDDTPWYSCVRLFRQHEPREWSDVVTRVRDELDRAALGAQAHASPRAPDLGPPGPPPLDVIVPSRGESTLTATVATLEAQSPRVHVWIRDAARGVPRAYNEGLREALLGQCDVMMLAAPGVRMGDGALAHLTSFMRATPRCGIAAPAYLDPTDAARVVSAGGLTTFPVADTLHGSRAEFQEPHKVHWADGAALLLRKAMVVEIGLLDESFVRSCFDRDYCFTARARGWEVWCCPAATCTREYAGEPPADECTRRADLVRFAEKWITGALYLRLAYEKPSREQVTRILAKVRESMLRLVVGSAPRR